LFSSALFQAALRDQSFGRSLGNQNFAAALRNQSALQSALKNSRQ
jgi:hypothetical protein